MFFSIITVTLNSEATIANTVGSVLSQTCEDFEYIIQDGGSNDSTLEIVKKAGRGRVGIYTEKDSGISDAFNRGILKARGEYVLLLSSDDVLFDRFTLQKVKEFIKAEGSPAIVHGDTVQMHENVPQVVYGRADIDPLRRGMIVNHSTCFVSNQVYQALGRFRQEYKIAMDYEFLLRCYLAKIKFSYLPMMMTRIGMGGVSSRNTTAALAEVYRIQREHGISLFSAGANYLRSVVRLFVRNVLTRLRLQCVVNFYQRHISINKKMPLA